MTDMEADGRNGWPNSPQPRSPVRQPHDSRGPGDVFTNPYGGIGAKRPADSDCARDRDRDRRNIAGPRKNFWNDRPRKHYGSSRYQRAEYNPKPRDSGQYRDRYQPRDSTVRAKAEMVDSPSKLGPSNGGERRSYPERECRSPTPVKLEEGTQTHEGAGPSHLLCKAEPMEPPGLEKTAEPVEGLTRNDIKQGSEPVDVVMVEKPDKSALEEDAKGSTREKGLGESRWEKEKLESRLQAMERALSERESRIAALEKEKVEVSHAEQAWDSRRVEQEKKLAELTADLTQKESAIGALEKSIAEERAARDQEAGQVWEGQKAEMEGRIRALESTLSQKVAHIDALERNNVDVSKSAYEWETRFHKVKESHEAARKHVVAQRSELKSLRQRAGALQQELDQTKSLLEVRTEENKVAQAFMTTADHYSLADLARMVESLNDEIFQCAMDISDALLAQQTAGLSFTPEQDDAWKPIFDSACASVVEVWSADVVSHLRAEVAKGETILFECLIQNIVVTRCEHIIQNFFPERPEVNRYMKELWKDVTESQPTPIAKNWLAITNSSLKRQLQDKEAVTTCLANMLATAGWRPPTDEPRDWENTVKGKVSDILDKATKIKEAMWEGILSKHVQVFTMEPRRAFNSASMEDAHGVPGKGAGNSDGGLIVCTTALGVCCKVRNSSSAASEETGWELEMVLKPKVLLESTIS